MKMETIFFVEYQETSATGKAEVWRKVLCTLNGKTADVSGSRSLVIIVDNNDAADKICEYLRSHLE